MGLKKSHIDPEGFRANVAIVLTNDKGQLFWAKRVGMDAWQFPQGGIRANESVEKAMYRELREETGLLPEHIEIMGCTDEWLHYRLPEHLIRQNKRPVCVGQKQIWYLLRLIGDESEVVLDASKHQEFEHWRWVDISRAIKEVVDFKRQVYEEALSQLSPLLFHGEARPVDQNSLV